MPYFDYHGHNLFYEEFGRGAPLLLLHGNTASSRMFCEIAAKFAQDHRVILLDFLGCGRSDRVEALAEDLWYDEAMQAVRLLEGMGCRSANVVGTSGGALAALNLALERPDLVGKLVADSFEGENALPEITNALRKEREASKRDPGAMWFYEAMNGADWKRVVDADTRAILAHAERICNFFHKPISALQCEILFTGSKEDPFCPDGFYENLFAGMLHKIGHGQMRLFDHGDHPAMLSNADAFVALSEAFFACANTEDFRAAGFSRL